MEDKKHYESNSETDFSASDNNSVDEIIEFYKDKPFSLESDDVTTEDINPDTNNNLFRNIIKTHKAEKPDVSGGINDDEDIHSGSYGMNRKHRAIAAHAVTVIICIAIVSGSYLLALIMPRDNEAVNSYANQLRTDGEYISLSNQSESLSHKVSELRASNEAKKAKIENISDYDNTKAALRSEISKKAEELSSLNTQISEKRTLIDTLNKSISEKTASVITLDAGKYVIGTHIAAGKYFVTGSGTFSAASSGNVSKYNISLGNSNHEVVLNKGDIIKINSTTKFTSAN